MVPEICVLPPDWPLLYTVSLAPIICSRNNLVCGCSGGGACVVAGGEGAWDTTRYGDTVNERAVRILLECILVSIIFSNDFNLI